MAAETTASRFTFREISGPSPQQVELVARSLPYRPVAFVGEQRLKVRNYQGSSVASVQVLGSKEEPLVIRGMFKDVFLGEGKARELRNRIDAIRRRGRLLEVRWSDLLRHAILRRAEFPHLRDQDIGFELTFEVISQGEAAAPVAANFVEAGSSFFSQANDLVLQMRRRLLDLEESVVTVGPLADALAAGEEAIDLVENAQDSVSAGLLQADLSLDVARNLVARARAVVAGNEELLGLLGETVPQALAEGQGIEAVLRATVAVDDMESSARDAAVFGVRLEGDVLAFTQPDVAAAVTLSPGQDLRSVAAAFLGTADAWERIADYNGLAGSDQPPGTIVLIPRA